ncbi:MAG: hypothetical protein OXN89_13690 [Bryobacterales bacterium]|nr:hypothetical protein [Bryobacterales bacterium]
MSAELIGILGVGGALAGLILTGKHDTDQRLANVGRRLARVEALLKGLGLPGRAGATGTVPGD